MVNLNVKKIKFYIFPFLIEPKLIVLMFDRINNYRNNRVKRKKTVIYIKYKILNSGFLLRF